MSPETKNFELNIMSYHILSYLIEIYFTLAYGIYVTHYDPTNCPFNHCPPEAGLWFGIGIFLIIINSISVITSLIMNWSIFDNSNGGCSCYPVQIKEAIRFYQGHLVVDTFIKVIMELVFLYTVLVVPSYSLLQSLSSMIFLTQSAFLFRMILTIFLEIYLSRFKLPTNGP